MSVGLADPTYASSALDVIACADAALLTAKQEGRDQLIASKDGRSDLTMEDLTLPR